MGVECIAVVGLGYVGLPLAVAFGKKIKTIGFDIDSYKIERLKKYIDTTGEVKENDLKEAKFLQFTSDPSLLTDAQMIIIAVPTPITQTKLPDLFAIKSATKLVGQNLSKNTIVVYESTVYPGVTEEVCMPILEKESGLKCGKDFFIGYSPERINPGDPEHRLENIVKVVAAQDENTLETIAKTYELVVKAGTYKAESIKVAEAAKVIENTQRDLNIALMNELAIIFNKLDIDTTAVLKAAGTKWNFLKFSPGLVGGHCIGVDPYYLTYKAQQIGYHPEVILAGRRINDYMGRYIAERTVKELIHARIQVESARVIILGFTFKENCPDIRNTRVIDIIDELHEYGIEPLVHDPIADPEEAQNIYGIKLLKELPSFVDAAIIAVKHNEYIKQGPKMVKNILAPDKAVVIDVKAIFKKEYFDQTHTRYWRL